MAAGASASGVPSLPRQSTLPSTVVRYNRPLAAAMPSKVGIAPSSQAEQLLAVGGRQRQELTAAAALQSRPPAPPAWRGSPGRRDCGTPASSSTRSGGPATNSVLPASTIARAWIGGCLRPSGSWRRSGPTAGTSCARPSRRTNPVAVRRGGVDPRRGRRLTRRSPPARTSRSPPYRVILRHRGVAEILGLAVEAVHAGVVEDHQPAAGGEVPGPEPAAVVAVDRLAVHPVGAPEPGVVEEARAGEEVVAHVVGPRLFARPAAAFCARPAASLIGAMCRRTPFEVERLGPHVDRAAVAGEDVGQGHRHVLPLHLASAGSRRSRGSRSSITRLGELAAGLRVEPQQPHAAVEERRAAGHAVHRVAVRPARCRRPARPIRAARRPPAGGRPARRGTARRAGRRPARRQYTQPSAEPNSTRPSIDRGRRIDAPAGRVAPGGLARVGIQGVHRVRDRRRPRRPCRRRRPRC